MSARRVTVAVDPGQIDLLRDVRFDSAGDPIYAMMVTGKDAFHRAFATNAIISFLAQTYGNRHLVIVNDGDYEFEVAGVAAERILQIQVDRKLRLGALRNLALDRIPPHAVWVQWDDDDWHHPALIAEQHDVLTSRGVDACFLRRQIKYAFARNAAWSDMWPGGFAGTLMTRNFPDVRYPDVARSEDSAYGCVIQQRYRHCDWDNPAEYYIRFIHGHNTWPDSHFALASRRPNEWRMSIESADYLRATLTLYEQAVGGPRAEPLGRASSIAMTSSPRTLNFFTAVGDAFGAGIAGKGFALALAERVDLRLAIVSPPNVPWQSRMSSPEEIRALKTLAEKTVSREAASFVRGAPMARRWHCPDDWPRRGSTLGHGVRRGAFVGHVFCEFERLLPEEIEFLRQADWITTGCNWATRVLLDHEMERVATVHQGIELDLFRPPDTPVTRPPELEGKFLIFSGGKYEYRKGVDLTIAAFAAFAQRHADALLLINAFNPWPWSQRGLAVSPHFQFAPVRTYPDDFARVLVMNGIPSDRFRILEPGPRADLARTMAMSDCGVFPIRCEAGTNHFLMEYMACARPAIATYTTGLLDILRPGLNSVGLTSFRQVQPALTGAEAQRGLWNEPTVDEIVEALESLYRSEDTRERLGRAAAQDMRPFAWHHCAERLLQVIDAAETEKASSSTRALCQRSISHLLVTGGK